MPLYIFQEADSNIFKVGRTDGSVSETIKQYKRANWRSFSVFHVFDTSELSSCESFFHRMLAENHISSGGGWEFYKVDPLKMRRLADDYSRMFEESSALQEEIAQLKIEQDNGNFLKASNDDRRLLERLLQIKSEQEALKFERNTIEGILKKRIGLAAGINGIASWNHRSFVILMNMFLNLKTQNSINEYSNAITVSTPSVGRQSIPTSTKKFRQLISGLNELENFFPRRLVDSRVENSHTLKVVSSTETSRDHAHAIQRMSCGAISRKTGVVDKDKKCPGSFPRMLRRRAPRLRRGPMRSPTRFRCSRRSSSPSSTKPST